MAARTGACSTAVLPSARPSRSSRATPRPASSAWLSSRTGSPSGRACPGPRRAWARWQHSRSSSPRTGRRSSTGSGAVSAGTDALVEETDVDTLRDVRQVLVIDAKGNTGVYTGPGLHALLRAPCGTQLRLRGQPPCRGQSVGPDGRGVREDARRARRSPDCRPGSRTGRRRRLARDAVGRDGRREGDRRPRSHGRTASSTCGSRTMCSRSPNSRGCT